MDDLKPASFELVLVHDPGNYAVLADQIVARTGMSIKNSITLTRSRMIDLARFWEESACVAARAIGLFRPFGA